MPRQRAPYTLYLFSDFLRVLSVWTAVWRHIVRQTETTTNLKKKFKKKSLQRGTNQAVLPRFDGWVIVGKLLLAPLFWRSSSVRPLSVWNSLSYFAPTSSAVLLLFLSSPGEEGREGRLMRGLVKWISEDSPIFLVFFLYFLKVNVVSFMFIFDTLVLKWVTQSVKGLNRTEVVQGKIPRFPSGRLTGSLVWVKNMQSVSERQFNGTYFDFTAYYDISFIIYTRNTTARTNWIIHTTISPTARALSQEKCKGATKVWGMGLLIFVSIIIFVCGFVFVVFCCCCCCCCCLLLLLLLFCYTISLGPFHPSFHFNITVLVLLRRQTGFPTGSKHQPTN